MLRSDRQVGSGNPPGAQSPGPTASPAGGRFQDLHAVLTKIGTNGKICIYTQSTTDVIIDVNGYVV